MKTMIFFACLLILSACDQTPSASEKINRLKALRERQYLDLVRHNTECAASRIELQQVLSDTNDKIAATEGGMAHPGKPVDTLPDDVSFPETPKNDR